MGKYIVKNVNFFIVFLLLLTVGALIVSSMYFQSRFDNLSEDYILTLERVKNISSSLDTYQSLYLEALSDLNESTADVQQYDELFSTKTEELDKTSQELTSAKSNLKSTTSKLITAEADLKTANYNLGIKTADLKQANKDLALLRSDYSDLSKDYNKTKNDYDDLSEDYEDLEDQLDACQNP